MIKWWPCSSISRYFNLDGTISTSVYRKPTHKNCYLDFSSRLGFSRYNPKPHVLLYIKGLSEAIKRVLSPLSMFLPHSTLRQKLVHVKDPMQMANVVYSIPCTTCFAVYIGQTGRLLKTRLDEYKTAVKHAKCDTSAVSGSSNITLFWPTNAYWSPGTYKTPSSSTEKKGSLNAVYFFGL